MFFGTRVIRFLILLGCLLAFAGLYAYFFYEIWFDAPDDKPPDLDKQLVYVASALGGVLGTFFAVALGVQRRDPNIEHKELRLGQTLVGPDPGPGRFLGNSALLIYFVVGVLAGVTAIFRSVQSPDAIKALASVFGGYALAVFSGAFSGNTGGGSP